LAFTRRAFLAGAAGAGAGFALGAFSHTFPLASPRVGPDWRPGKETFTPSTCLLCPSHCGIRARLIDGALVRIDGNPLHPVSQGGLCPKGRAGLQLLYHPARLTGPIERVGPPGSEEFRLISWESALERVTAALRERHDRGEGSSVAWLTGDVSGVMAELIQAFCGALGSSRILAEDYRDGSAEVMRLSHGIARPPAFDLDSSDLVMSFGAAMSEAWWSLPLAARARGGDAGERPRWVQFDVRHSRSAAAADQWVAARPGTYGAIALAIAYVMLKEGLYDTDTVARRVSGFDDWVDDDGVRQVGYRALVLRHGRPEEVAARTGVPVATLISLGKAFGTARRPVAVWDQCVSWRRSGLADALAIHALNIIAGSSNRPGGVVFRSDLPVPALAPQALETADGSGSSPAFAGAHWASELVAAGQPPLDALFLYYANPVASAARPGDVIEVLDRTPLVVSFSPFLDESARHADLVLPDHTYLERWQDAPGPATTATTTWGVVRPVVEPLHDTRSTGDVLLKLASSLGGQVAAACPWSSMEEIVRGRGAALGRAHRGSAFLPETRREELRELESRGWWIPSVQSDSQRWQAIHDAGGWFDPYHDYNDRSAISQFDDGRMWVFPGEARRRLRSGNTDLGDGILPSLVSTLEQDREHPLMLIPYRVMTLASGTTALMPWLLERIGLQTGNAWESWVEINPETARELGLTSARRVRVESPRGMFEAPLRVVNGAQPGVVNVPYGLHTSVTGWGTADVANPLTAVGGEQDPLTGLPDWYSTRVKLIAV